MPCEIFMLGVVSCRYTRIFRLVLYMKGKNKRFWGRGWRLVGAKVNKHSQTGGGTFFTFLSMGTTHLALQEYISLTFKISYLLLCRNGEAKTILLSQTKMGLFRVFFIKKIYSD
jgi:hypothetical protein